MLDRDHSKSIDELEFKCDTSNCVTISEVCRCAPLLNDLCLRYFLEAVARLMLRTHSREHVEDVVTLLLRGAPKMWLYLQAS